MDAGRLSPRISASFAALPDVLCGKATVVALLVPAEVLLPFAQTASAMPTGSDTDASSPVFLNCRLSRADAANNCFFLLADDILPCTNFPLLFVILTNSKLLLTYLSSSSPVGHKATTMLRHKVLSFAEAWASPQDSPISFSSAITDCRHVIFGHPRFLFCLGAFAEHALAILVVCV